MVRVDKRGQAFTLEGFVAAMLVLASLAFSMQMTGVTPLSASTSSQHVENQQAAMARGLLDSARADGSLHGALLYWNGSNGTFHGTESPPDGDGYYTACGMRNETGYQPEFGEHLERTLDDQGLACNVNVRSFNATTSTIETRRLVFAGTPTDNAVRVVTTVTLYDDDVLYDRAGNPTVTNLTSVASNPDATFYTQDADPDGPVYGVVQVEVIVWRT